MLFFKIIFLFFFFFVSGYLLTLTLSNLRGFFKRFSLSFGFGISLAVVFSLVFLLLDLLSIKQLFPFLVFFVALIFIILVIFLVFIKKGDWGLKKFLLLFEEWNFLSKKEKIFFLVFLAAAILSALFVFYPHFFPKLYLYPIHADEWWSASAVKNVVLGRDININPYTFYKEINYKPGFTAFWAMIFSFLGKDPVQAWPFLPSLNVFLISLFASLLLYEKTKNLWASVAVPFLVSALNSNINVLGWWFFVPFTFAFFFILFLFLLQDELFLESKTNLIGGFLIATSLGSIYLPFLGFFVLFFLPSFEKFFRKFKTASLVIVFLFVVLFFVFLSFSPYKNFWEDIEIAQNYKALNNFLKAFFVPNSATPSFNYYLNIFKIIPPFLFVFSFVGIFFAAYFKGKEILVRGFFLCLIFYLFILLFDVSFLSFYGREFYLFGFITVLLGALGVGKVMSVFQSKTLQILSFLLIVFLCLSGYILSTNSTGLYYLVDEKNKEAMNWLGTQQEPKIKESFVFADASLGLVITPLSGLRSKVNWISIHNKGLKDVPFTFDVFDKLSCPQKEEILRSLDTKVLYGTAKQNCDFLKEIYNKEGIFIYVVKE